MLRNKKFLGLFLSLALVLSILVGATPQSAFADEVKDTVELTILGTTDLHGNIYNWSYEDNKEVDYLGMAKVYSVVKEARAKNPNTILLDNGDTIQGTILTDEVYNNKKEKPNPVIAAMNFMEYDSMTLGNHEFNFGLDMVKKIIKEANFPILSANTKYKKDNSHLALPSTIVERGGVKVGIIGLTTPEIPKWDGAKVEDLKFENMAMAAQETIKELKGKVDIIVATTHAHYEDSEGLAAKEVIEKNPEIAAFLVGHSHSTLNEKVGNVPVGAARDQGREVVKFDLKLKRDKDSWAVVESEVEIIEVESYQASEDLKEHTKEYHNATLEYISEVIGKASEDFTPKQEIKGIPEAQIRDTAVMDIINNVQLKAADADVSSAALFKSSSNIKAGDVTYASIFDIYKFPNTLYGIKVSGEQLKNYMEWSALYYNTFTPGDINISFDPNVRSYLYDMFQGVDYKIDLSKPKGSRIVDATINGEAIEKINEIKLVLNDYRFEGMKTSGIFSEENEVYFESDPKSVREYIADFIKEEGTIKPVVDNNWEIIGVDLNHPLRDYIIGEVNKGNIIIPKSEDGRTDNVKGLNVYAMIKEGLIPEVVLKEHGIEVEEKPESQTIKILHVNDVHGRVEEDEREGAMGFAILKTKVDELRAENPNLLLLNVGDTTHGTTIVNISQGAAMIDLMNIIGFDALVPGNHDFNYGYKRLLELRDMAEFPVVGANVVNEEDGSLYFKPYTIKELDGVKVGIFGLVTDETKFKSHPDNTEGVKFLNVIKIAENMVKELKNEGADVIIALSHIGIEGTTTLTSKEIAENVKGIDLIVDGHSHEVLNEVVGDTLIVQADSYTRNIGSVDLEIVDGKVASKTATLIGYEEVKELTPDPIIEAAITKINEENEPILGEIVGKTTVDLGGERGDVRTGETNLGNLITDVMLKVSGADIALTNGGGIRASIPAGEISVKNLIDSFPFTNTVAVIEVKGQEIIDVLELGVKLYPEEAGGFPHVAGMSYKFNPTKPIGERIVEVLVKGEPINPEETYKLVTNDFIAAGGDDYAVFKGRPFVGEDGLLSDILIDYIREIGEVSPVVEGRIVADEIEGPAVVLNKYTVKTDDILWKIARKFNTTWENLAKINNLKNPHLIFPSQQLLVPEI